MKKITNPHDRYFREAMSYVKVAKEFFSSFLPKKFREIIDLDTLELKKESFIDSNLKEVISDILYSVKINNNEGYIYLLAEHQSTPDRLMSLRMMRYTTRIMYHHIEALKNKYAPIVIPIVFYHGTKPYIYSNNLFDLFHSNEQQLAHETLLQPFHLIDVNKIPDEELKQAVRAGMLTLIQKHIFKRDIMQIIQDITPLLKRLYDLGENSYIMTGFNYLIHALDLNTQQFANYIGTHVNPKLGEETMTAAERLRQEGLQEGLLRGKAQGKAKGIEVAKKNIAVKLIAEGFNLADIQRLTDLPINVIESLAKKETIN